ncbi:sensor histidine kinase [Williamsia sp. MIQD14]|uniref:sensor histidine kinase n=1 Tax=Williamsia sp. MIQD14 TaxID=3425703 RepID=UPI003DA13275
MKEAGDVWSAVADRPRSRDACVSLAFLALGVVLYAADLSVIGGNTGTPFDLPRWLGLVTLAAACGAQSLRSTAPGIALTACVVVVALDTAVAQSISVWLVASDVVYAVALYAGRRTVHTMYAALGAIAVLAFASVVAVGAGWQTVLLAGLWTLALVIAPIGYGRAIAEHRVAAAGERERSAILAQLADRDRADAVAEERRRLARDLHDIVAGHLSGIALQSAAAMAAGPASPITAEVLASVRANSVAALGEMRAMIDVLDGDDRAGDVLDTGSPAASVRTASLRRIDHLVTTARTAGSPVVVTPEVPPDLPPTIDVCAYRIVAEALTNAARHAPRQPISVALDADGAGLTLTVRNAVPEDTAAVTVGGHGIANMALRARAAGGHCTAARVGDEWVVTAHLPTADGQDVP